MCCVFLLLIYPLLEGILAIILVMGKKYYIFAPTKDKGIQWDNSMYKSNNVWQH